MAELLEGVVFACWGLARGLDFGQMSFMGTVGTVTALRRVRVWLGHAVLVAFVLRALVPAGYMPDFSAGDSFKIVICTANGTKLVDASGGTADPGSALAKHTGEPCALSGLAALVAPDMAASPVQYGQADFVFVPDALAVRLPPVRAGPAHSPRAPPSLV